MSQLIVAGVCGFVGDVIAVILLGSARGDLIFGFSRGPGQEQEAILKLVDFRDPKRVRPPLRIRILGRRHCSLLSLAILEHT